MPNADIPPFGLGDRMRRAREWRGIGVEEMAERLSRNRNTITNWERGRSQPTDRVVGRWAAECSVPYEWLVTGESVSACTPFPPLPLKVA